MRKKFILVDYIDEAINTWALQEGFLPPAKKLIEEVKQEEIESIKKVLGCECVLIQPPTTDFVINKQRKQWGVICLSPFFFKNILRWCCERQIPCVSLDVSRCRIPYDKSSFYPGNGVLLGRNRTLPVQLQDIINFGFPHTCVILDESVSTGRTLEDLTEKLFQVGIETQEAWVGVNLLKNGQLSKRLPVRAVYKSTNTTEICVELKDFFDFFNSGACYPQGTYKKRGVKIDLSLASQGRVSYLWPYYKTNHWQTTWEQWYRLSMIGHKLSLRIYKEVERKSKKKVKVKNLLSLSEERIDPETSVIQYLSNFII